ncbi:hypothetical protein FRC07_004432 [Ceratobasidium sp. 392]|nr:hypothetical protein FRC07_004432 [Ceratobasidium sp. 392]
MHSLASTYFQQDRLDLAEEISQEVVAIRKHTLGDDQVETLESMHDLAYIYLQQNRLLDAELLTLEVWSLRQRKLGDTHPDTLRTMHNLAGVYFKQDRLGEAKSLFLQALAGRKLVLGDAHIETLLNEQCLAKTYSISITNYEEDSVLEPSSSPALIFGVQERLSAAIRNKPSSPGDHKARGFSTSRTKATQFGNNDNQRVSAPLSSKDFEANLVLENDHLANTQTHVSSCTTASDAFEYLIQHGCFDLTAQLDLASCPDAALIGGRFGEVWHGRLNNHTQVAIKCLRLHTVDEASVKVIKRAAKELRLWSKLKHDNVLELLGFAMFQERLAMISPWMKNGTLRDYVQEHPEVNRWGLVHGDLKAANILVSADGVPKISDFGNSVLANCSLSFSGTNVAGGGTARWMAPELTAREDSAAADRSMSADVYALGMTILVGDYDRKTPIRRV